MRAAPLAFVAGTTLGLVTSAGLVEERLTLGSPTVAFVVNALVSACAIVVLALLTRREEVSRGAAGAALGGAIAGIVLVHAALHFGVIGVPYWLAERPPQLVNDAVAVLSTLLLVWACARNLDVRLFAAALLVVTAYRLTAHLWHLDGPPGAFSLKVQDLVPAQFVAAAIALPFFRQLTRTAP